MGLPSSYIEKFSAFCLAAFLLGDAPRAGACAAVCAHEAFNLFPELRDDLDCRQLLIGNCNLGAFHTAKFIEMGQELEAKFHAENAAHLCFLVFPTLRGAM